MRPFSSVAERCMDESLEPLAACESAATQAHTGGVLLGFFSFQWRLNENRPHGWALHIGIIYHSCGSSV